jgi:hypothetical protein
VELMNYNNFIDNILLGNVPYNEINILYSNSRKTAANIISDSIIENNLQHTIRYTESGKNENYRKQAITY